MNNCQGIVAEIEIHEVELNVLYNKVYDLINKYQYQDEKPTLNFKKEQLCCLEMLHKVNSSLDRAVVVLKGIIGSTNEDYIQLEFTYNYKIPEIGDSIGEYIHEELKNMGLNYSKLYDYLKCKGLFKVNAHEVDPYS